MTRDDIIRMAEETGINWDLGKGPFFYFTTNGIERFAALVAAAEREACAKVCEADSLLWGQKYAAAIRARN